MTLQKRHKNELNGFHVPSHIEVGVIGAGSGQVGQGIIEGFSRYGRDGRGQALCHSEMRTRWGSEEVFSREETYSGVSF